MTVRDIVNAIGPDSEEEIQICEPNEWEVFVAFKAQSALLIPFMDCEVKCMGAEDPVNTIDLRHAIRIDIDYSKFKDLEENRVWLEV